MGIRLVKFVDCWDDMPDKIRTHLFEIYGGQLSNESLISWHMGDGYDDGSSSDIIERWLVDNDATEQDVIFIRFYW